MKKSQIDEVGHSHMIQVRPDTHYSQSFPSEYYPGTINPLKRRILRQNLNINSQFRANYSTTLSTNFNVVLPMIFNNIYSMSLSSIELPLSFFLISERYGNNFFILSSSFAEPALVKIPDGNYYTNNSLLVAIQSAINETVYKDIIYAQIEVSTGGVVRTVFFSQRGTDDEDGPTFSVLFNTDLNGNALVPNKHVAAANVSNSDLPLKLGWVLGFREGKYRGKSRYKSEGLVDTRGPSYLYLVVDDFNNSVNNGFYSAFQSSILNKNILARISLKPSIDIASSAALPAELYSPVQTIQNNLSYITVPREYFGPVNLRNMNIQLLDCYGRIVDLNCMDFSFCLTLTKQYDL
jgi:hypothetical protein